jgi:predicted amidohydrolase
MGGSMRRRKDGRGATRRRWTVAAVQMTSTADRDANREQATRLIRSAAARGADLVALPENFAYLRTEGTKVRYSERLDGPLVGSMADLARETGCWLLLGSIPERTADPARIRNTSVLLDPTGAVAAVYRKMHLFDIAIRGKATLQESRWVDAGDRPVVASTPLGRLGLSICYDLRFPELYRRLALAGAQVLFVPAAFTAYTGPFHWEPLLRARAIENQCWVVAPAQAGRHNPERASHGHTVVFDPWGERVALRRSRPGVVLATVDLDAVDRVRAGLPCLDHVRPFLTGRRLRL